MRLIKRNGAHVLRPPQMSTVALSKPFSQNAVKHLEESAWRSGVDNVFQMRATSRMLIDAKGHLCTLYPEIDIE